MGINVISNTQSQELQLVATSTVNSGDLITLTDGGQPYIVSNALTLAQNNVTTTGASAISAYASRLPSFYGFQSTLDLGQTAVQLGNGIVAVVHQGNGSTVSTGVRVSYFSQAFGGFQPMTTVSSFSGIQSSKIIRLSSSKFVVGYTDGTSVYARVINNDGTTASTEITVNATTSSNSGAGAFYNIFRLSDTRFVVAYNKTTTAGGYFKIYDDTGTIVGAEVLIEAGGAEFFEFLLHSTTGEFWIKWKRYAATQSHRFARFNSSGVMQGSVVTIANLSNVFAQNMWSSIYELSNGNVLIFCPEGSGYPDMYTYSSTGNSVASNNSWHTNNASIAVSGGCPAMVVNSDGTFWLATITSSATARFAKFNNSLNNITVVQGVPTFIVNSGNGYGTLRMFLAGSSGFFISVSGYNGSVYSASILAIDSAGSIIGSKIDLFTGGGNLYGSTAIRLDSGAIAAIASNSQNTVSAGLYNTGRKSIIGVSQQTVSSGATFRCATNGTFTINNPPANPGYFDNRTATPGGCRGTLAGTTAVLFGLV
jgi:hypothetical protein